MKLKYLTLSLLFLITFACGENKKELSDNDHSDTVQTRAPNPNPVDIEYAIFTDPALTASKTSDTRIMDSLIQYLNYTPKGADVYISIYLFYYKPVVNAIKTASGKGVNVHVLIDESRNGKEKNISTYRQLKNTLREPSTLQWVFNDAASSGTEAINHEKYVLFSEVHLEQGVAKNLVFATSHNFILNGTKKAQDAIVMTNEELYNVFLNNWKEVASRAQSGMKDFTYTIKNVGDSITVFFFPRRENGKWDGKNTILEQLDKLSEYNKDTIRVLMASWSGKSGVKIAERLTELQTKGVTVQVIARSSSSDAVKSALQK